MAARDSNSLKETPSEKPSKKDGFPDDGTRKIQRRERRGVRAKLPVKDDLLGQIEDRQAKISFLQEMADVLVHVDFLPELFDQIARKAQELLPYEICSTHLVDEARSTISVVLDPPPPLTRTWRGANLKLGEGAVGWVAKTGELLNIPDDVATAALLPLGFPAEGVGYGPTRRRALEEVAFDGLWGNGWQLPESSQS